MCVTGMSGICGPASICSTCAQKASGMDSPASICVTGMPGIRGPASICSTCAQKASGMYSPASICTRCAWQACLESAVLPAVATHVAKGLQELAALPAFEPDVRGRNVWNLQPCQQLKHLWPEGFRSWQPCQHLQQMCVAGMFGICYPASICSTWGFQHV